MAKSGIGISAEISLHDKMSAVLARVNKMLGESNTALKDVQKNLDTSTTVRASVDEQERSTKAVKETADATQELVQHFHTTNKTIETTTNTTQMFVLAMEEAKDASEKVPKPLKKSQNLMQSLLGLATRLGAVLALKRGVGALVKLSDKTTEINVRMGQLTKSQSEVAALNDLIFASAQRSRGSYLETADAVAKIGVATEGLWSSNEELVRFAEQLNMQYALAGTSTEGAKAATLQLTQALGSGVLRGEELNSVFEQAPNIIRTIAEHMGQPIGAVRDLAAEGKITAEVVKNAMLGAAEETTKAFTSAPLTFGQAIEIFKNNANRAFENVAQRINAILNDARVRSFIDNLSVHLTTLGNMVLGAIESIAAVAFFVSDHWNIIVPLVSAATVVVLAFKAAAIKAKLAALGLNAALLANPLTWIVAGVALVIAAIASWVQSVGGIQIAWTQFMHFLERAGLRLRHGFPLFFKIAFEGIMGFLRSFGGAFLAMLEDIINSAIDVINHFIGMLNKLPGVSIDFVEKASFGTEAMLRAEAANAAGQAEIERMQKRRDNAMTGLRWKQQEALAKLERARPSEATAETDILKQQRQLESMRPLLQPMEETAKNTGAMADSLDIAEEELVYLRDIAERDAINKYTTAEVRVDFTANNHLSDQMSLERVGAYLTESMRKTMVHVAEGTY